MRTIVFAYTLAMFVAVPAATQSDGLAERVAQRYATLESYYLQGTFLFAMEVAGTSQEFRAPFIEAGGTRGRMRLEIDHDELGSLIVSDGEATWTYFKAMGQYRKNAAVPIEGTGGGHTGGAASPAASGSFLRMYTAVAAETVTPREVGTDSVRCNGRTVGCAVIELTHAVPDTSGVRLGPDTLWVDPEAALVLKSVHRVTGQMQGMTSSSRMELAYHTIRMGEAPPEELFVFEPPAGAQEVDDFTMGGASRPDLTGTEAPDFRLSDLKGKPHRLANYRGKVVLLDFWASWCEPCRKELPTIEKLHREYGGKGLVVLAVTYQDEKVARSFMKKYGYTFTVLTDVEGSAFDQYAVSSIPVTVVIDREGRIAAHIIGYQGENALLSSIREGGIQ
jgi:peroxiredoxin/outer membrane lipoprotein-sorting protein